MLSVRQIEEEIKNLPYEAIPAYAAALSDDSRASVRRLAASALKRYERHIAEIKRLEGISLFEKELCKKGCNFVAGVDEVGRGPLAGPVVTAAVILKPGCLIEGINDSKKLTERKREELYDIITAEAVACSVAMEDNTVIDEINILEATRKAMKSAVEGLAVTPDWVLVDALTIPDISIPQQAIIKGDEKSISIGAASIVAKVTRDRLMKDMAKLYTGYDFESNKGYGTQKHIEAIKKNGLCPIHRKSFTKGIINYE